VAERPASAPEPETTQGPRGLVRAAVLAVLLVYAVGWSGFLTAGEVGIRGGGPEMDAAAERTVVGVAPGSPADRAGIRAGDAVVALGGVPAGDPAFDRATVATRAGQSVTLRVRRVLPGGGHGPAEDVVVTADPVLASTDKRLAAARDAAIGAVLMLVSAAVVLRWPAAGAGRLLVLAAAAVAAAFGLRAWDVALPTGVAVWRAVGYALTVAGAAAALAAAGLAAARWRADRSRGALASRP
jgi:hypothetical protein